MGLGIISQWPPFPTSPYTSQCSATSTTGQLTVSWMCAKRGTGLRVWPACRFLAYLLLYRSQRFATSTTKQLISDE